jgi:Kef-type K+ transport system membrane component KefB
VFLIAYIVVGLILGPTSLNLHGNEMFFGVCAQGFLFVAGAELSLRELKKNFLGALKISLGAFLLPFAVGLMAGPWVTSNPGGGVILALALAISAMPVIVQILKELKIYDTRMGHIIISAATVCDILAWLIFIFVVPAENRSTWIKSHWPILFFFIGLLLSDLIQRSPKFTKLLLKSSEWVFAPFFFVGVGMKIHLQENFDVTQFAAVFILAVVSKVVGVYAIARLAKFTNSEASLMAVVLNARGAMEILYATLALSLGMIDATLFASLVLMAVMSSVMAAPIARRWRVV